MAPKLALLMGMPPLSTARWRAFESRFRSRPRRKKPSSYFDLAPARRLIYFDSPISIDEAKHGPLT
jgi:hypothetical protein